MRRSIDATDAPTRAPPAPAHKQRTPRDLVVVQAERVVAVGVDGELLPIAWGEVDIVRVVAILTNLHFQNPILDGVAECVGVVDEAVNCPDVNVMSHERKSAMASGRCNSRQGGL